MAHISKRSSLPVVLVLVLLCVSSFSPAVEAGSSTDGSSAATPTVKTIKNTGGGTIVYGPLSGQLTPQVAISETLKRVDNDYGEKPQLGKVLQNQAGTIWEGFFTVNDKKQTKAAMTGLVIVYAPKSGTAGGATLIDTTANFPKSANSMLQNLVQAVTNNAKAAQNARQGGASTATANVATAPAQNAPQNGASTATANVPSAPAQKLTPYAFPDGSGSVGLPPGWTPVNAHLGDVSAKGPNGERLRFGMPIFVLDPDLPQSRTLTGLARANYVTIRYNQDPATIFQQAINQLSQKGRVQPPTLTIKQTKDLGGMQQGKNFLLLGDIDRHDGSGPQTTVAQLMISAPNPQLLGSYQITLLQITGPPEAMQQEVATNSAMFSSYNPNGKVINDAAIQGLQQIQAQDRANADNFNRQMAATDLASQGMSDLLRGETVFTDNDTGMRYRGPDDLASALQNANPNRFQTVPLSQYIHGVDY